MKYNKGESLLKLDKKIYKIFIFSKKSLFRLKNMLKILDFFIKI